MLVPETQHSHLPTQPIPAPGFKLISGKRSPPKDGAKYRVQFRNGWIDERTEYEARQMVWVHDGSAWDIVAIQRV